MMDDDGPLLLNISNDPTASGGKKKHKPAGSDQKLRIRERQKEKYRETVSDWRKFNKYESKQAKAVAKRKLDDEPESTSAKTARTSTHEANITLQPKAKGGLVISSLFNKNPEVPELTNTNVIQNEEKVFTKNKFSELDLHPHLISCLEEKMCLSEMTEVQKQSIPHLLKGSDALIKSQTGSGKTLSYAVPMIQSLRSTQPKITRSDGTYAVILVPTRELALQSLATVKKLVQSCIWIVPGTVIGGESRKAEKARIRKGINIIIATPGRLADHCDKTSSLKLSNLQYIIIDEADRLLDMGFEKELSQIMTHIRHHSSNRKKQTILLSATLSSDVQRLASVTLNDPVTIDISANVPADHNKTESALTSMDPLYTCPSSLSQFYVVTPSKLRLVTLTAFILDKCKHSKWRNKLIVFLPSQEVVQFYFELFHHVLNNLNEEMDSDNEQKESEQSSEREVFALHGDMKQQYRNEVFTKYSKCKAGVLFCTDVAARGLDLPNVNWIVQFSPPTSTEDYIHRVGRTARIGGKGNALLFLLPSEVNFLETLRGVKMSVKKMEVDAILKSCMQEVENLPRKKNGGQLPRNVQEAATALQQSMEEWTYAEADRLAQAKSAYQSFVRAYATYPSVMKNVFHIKFLHLGHLAKSFCLREAPSGMTNAANSCKLSKRAQRYEKEKSMKKKRATSKSLRMSEFSSGL